MMRNAAVPEEAEACRGRVIVVGASARAMAESAARAGWDVHAADLFADVDLARIARCVKRVRGFGPTGYPLGLPAAIAGFPAGPCIFTGGLENHPDVLAEIARRRPLAGSPLAAIREVRDPDRLAALARTVGLEFPPTVGDPVGIPTDGSWLVKPRAGAGGRGIATWRGRRVARAGDEVWQRFVPGVACSMSFLTGPGGARLLGISRQLTGERWCRARPFAYCGSVATSPETLDAATLAQCERLGVMLAIEAGLVGLVGADVVIDARSRLHVIEINPRPTASLELFERATGEPLAAAHLAASGFSQPLPHQPPALPARPGIWSKAILFGPGRAVIAPATTALERLAEGWSAADGRPAIRDIPAFRSALPAGSPLVTVFARGESADESLAILRRRVAAVRRLFAQELSPQAAAASPAVRPRARTPSGRRPRSSPDRSP
jgi:predicted ATP-grasp superfamily ATP-dependent carboligase